MFKISVNQLTAIHKKIKFIIFFTLFPFFSNAIDFSIEINFELESGIIGYPFKTERTLSDISHLKKGKNRIHLSTTNQVAYVYYLSYQNKIRPIYLFDKDSLVISLDSEKKKLIFKGNNSIENNLMESIFQSGFKLVDFDCNSVNVQTYTELAMIVDNWETFLLHQITEDINLNQCNRHYLDFMRSDIKCSILASFISNLQKLKKSIRPIELENFELFVENYSNSIYNSKWNNSYNYLGALKSIVDFNAFNTQLTPISLNQDIPYNFLENIDIRLRAAEILPENVYTSYINFLLTDVKRRKKVYDTNFNIAIANYLDSPLSNQSHVAILSKAIQQIINKSHLTLDFLLEDKSFTSSLIKLNSPHKHLTFSEAIHQNDEVNWLFIEFWATWCRPCIGNLNKLKKLESQLSNISVALVSIDEDRSKWQEKVAQWEFGKTIENYITSPDSEIFKKLSPSGAVPLTLWINKKTSEVYLNAVSVEDLIHYIR